MTTRTLLRRDLADLKQKVYLLGEKCIQVADLYYLLLENYSKGIENRLLATAEDVKNECLKLNDQCFLVLTLQQPLIKDLRFVIGSLQIVLNLNKSVEQYLSTLSLISEVNILEAVLKDQLLKMCRTAQDLLRTSLTLYLSSNLDSYHECIRLFGEINYLHDVLYKQTLKEVAKESRQKVQIEVQLLATIRSLEKIADLTINIAEQVKYIIIGKIGETEQKTEA